MTPTGVEQARAAGRCCEGAASSSTALDVGPEAGDLDALARARRDGPDVAAGAERLAA
jgi:hypothetical protein